MPRVSVTKPVASPSAARPTAATVTVSGDPATMVGASADSVTPRGVDCAERLTVHGAAPPPASESRAAA